MGEDHVDGGGVVADEEASMTDDERIMRLIRGMCRPEVADRLEERVMGEGLQKYGPVDLDKDPRDWAQEAIAELLDACYYGGAMYIKAQRQGASSAMASRVIHRLDMCLWYLEGEGAA